MIAAGRGFGNWLSAAALAVLAAFCAGPARAETCEPERFLGAGYIVCTIDPAADDLRLFWQNGEGSPYRTFASLAEAMSAQGKDLVFAINAGMYRTDFAPLGLYVEDGEQRRPADVAVIEGPPGRVPNFYKKPNGVFFLGKAGAAILPTDDFLRANPDARFATQSGPMLVIENRLHPAFIPGSSDRTRRNGVGVCDSGRVRFAISEDDVNFHDFARLFRDHLSCRNALFLDGGRGAGLYLPRMARKDVSWHGGFGPIFGLLK